MILTLCYTSYISIAYLAASVVRAQDVDVPTIAGSGPSLASLASAPNSDYFGSAAPATAIDIAPAPTSTDTAIMDFNGMPTLRDYRPLTYPS